MAEQLTANDIAELLAARYPKLSQEDLLTIANELIKHINDTLSSGDVLARVKQDKAGEIKLTPIDGKGKSITLRPSR